MTGINQEIQATLDYLKTNADTMKGTVSPDTQKNFTTANGLQMYNLQPAALLMFPQLTPILNNTPRVQGKGKQAEYKAITGINTAMLNGWTAEGNSGQKVTTSFNDVVAVYKIFSLADGITFEAEWEGMGFTDVKALAVANLIRAMKIQEENNLLFGRIPLLHPINRPLVQWVKSVRQAYRRHLAVAASVPEPTTSQSFRGQAWGLVCFRCNNRDYSKWFNEPVDGHTAYRSRSANPWL